MNHECEQDERVRLIERKIDRIEERIEGNRTVFERDIKNIIDMMDNVKTFQSKLTWWIISLFGTSVITLIAIINKK